MSTFKEIVKQKMEWVNGDIYREEFNKIRLKWFARTVHDELLWPGRQVWRYTLLVTDFRKEDGALYTMAHNFYLTDEEYIMHKLEE